MVPVNISAKAIELIKQTIAQKNISPEYGLRIGVRGGSCGGVSYLLGFDHQNEGDGVYDLQGIPVYIAKKDLLFLVNMKIDFHEGNNARGFVFLQADQEESSFLPNPNE